jgi:hypothetical protein
LLLCFVKSRLRYLRDHEQTFFVTVEGKVLLPMVFSPKAC